MKRIMITEGQLKAVIREEHTKERVVERLSKELNNKYEPSYTTLEDKNGPTSFPTLKKRYDGEERYPKDVVRELKSKHSGLSEDFIEQVVKDWYNNTIDGGLSKNISMK